MSAFSSRGSSVLAALALVGALAVVMFAMQAFSGPQNVRSQAADVPLGLGMDTSSGAATNIGTPAAPAPSGSSSFTSQAPKDCTTAINVALNKPYGPPVTDTDNGQSGTLDTCYGAISKTGKPSSNAGDYQCVGRSGKVLIAGGRVIATTIPDQSVKPATCNVQVCNNSLDAQNCSAAKLFSNGLNFSNANGSPIVGAGNLPYSSANYVAGLSGGPTGNGSSVATGYYIDANGSAQLYSAFNPTTATAPSPSGWSQVSGFDAGLWPAGGSTAASLPFAPTTPAGNPTVYSAGLTGCSNGSCSSLTQQDLASSNPGSGASIPNGGAMPGGSPNPRLTAGDVAPADYYCIKNILPINVVQVPAGTAFPSGCYNDRNAPPLPQNNTFNNPGGTQQQLPPQQSNSNGGLGGLMNAILGGLAKGLAASNAPAAAPCSSDPNAYAQQQQQYNMQLQQYNMQLQQYNYQQQMRGYGGYGGYGAYGAAPMTTPPAPPQQCQQTSSSNTCPTAPAQPDPAGCANGTWRPITTQQSNGYQCTTSWQCVPGTAVVPTAQLSCQPQVVDVGMPIAISYSCGNATGSTGQGFDTQNQTSGSTSTVITTPPAGATGANFVLNCTNQGTSAQAQCSVQVGRPTIVLVANPKVVDPGSASTIGWVTSGMQSCVVSSPELPQFTADNAGNTSVNGMASTTPINSTVHILLHCTTIGGNVRDATTTISVAGQPDPGSTPGGSVTVTSSADAASIARGSTVQISWSTAHPSSGAYIALWLYDVALHTTTALIKKGLNANSSYAWQLPNATDACDPASNVVCGTDLIPGRTYSIEAALYTTTSDPNNPNYIDHGFTPSPFTVSD